MTLTIDELVAQVAQLDPVAQEELLQRLLALRARQGARSALPPGVPGAVWLAEWESLPAVYRQCAICSTDFWDAYACVLPSKRHRPVGKESGQTSHIERLNNTLRQRISRLVRKTLSFSKKVENHSGAIWYFVHHYNASLA